MGGRAREREGIWRGLFIRSACLVLGRGLVRSVRGESLSCLTHFSFSPSVFLIIIIVNFLYVLLFGFYKNIFLL
jgi:hypothetical protein